MLGNFVRQIVSKLPAVPDRVKELYRRRVGLQEVKGLLYQLLKSKACLTIVMDALDECEYQTRNRVLHTTTELQALTDVRLLATSRDICAHETSPLFQGQPSIEIKASKDDLENYARARAKYLEAKVQPDFEEEIVHGVANAADGMYVLLLIRFRL